MRRRSHVLVLVVGAAAALLLSAPALSAPPPWLTNELAAPAAPGIQHSPAIAVNPAAPGQAFVVADNGAGGQTSPLASTTAGATLDWTTSWNPSGPLQYSGFASAGQPDTAWGPGQTVYVAELGSTTGHSLCSSSAGILVSESADGGATFSPSDPASPIDTGSSGAPSSELIEPAIATSGTNVYVVYTELKWSGANCSGTPDSASILLASSSDSGSSFSTARRVSPLGISSRYRSPSVAPLPDGRVVVAFRDDSAPSPQIETETCSPFASPLGNYCGVSSGLVGPSTLVGDATAPSLVSGVVGPPTPSVIAAGGRVVVAWHAASDANVHVFAAMSTTNGASLRTGAAHRRGRRRQPGRARARGDGERPRRRRVPLGHGLRSPGDDRLGESSVARGDDRGVGAARRRAGRSGECRERHPGTARAARAAHRRRDRGRGREPAAGHRRGVHGTAAGDQDVHVAGLLHGTTAPGHRAPGRDGVQERPDRRARDRRATTTAIRSRGRRARSPRHRARASPSPTPPAATSPSRPPIRRAPTRSRRSRRTACRDTRRARSINVNVVNDPPEIICPSLVAREDTPLEIPSRDCVQRSQRRSGHGRPATTRSAAPSSARRGTWLFIPTATEHRHGLVRARGLGRRPRPPRQSSA